MVHKNMGSGCVCVGWDAESATHQLYVFLCFGLAIVVPTSQGGHKALRTNCACAWAGSVPSNGGYHYFGEQVG